MPDMQKLNLDKEKILSIIQTSGPSFPARLSRQTGISPLFVSAILAEMVSNKRLKLSNLKVGSSPLYFLEGQEQQLENFTDNLNSREKEAFQLLKDSQVLRDESLTPVIRVALRSIKDFAHPINVRLGDETKLFWRYFTLSAENSRPLIQQLLTKPKKILATPKPTQASTPTPNIINKPTSRDQPVSSETQQVIKSPSPKKPISEFSNTIKSILQAKDIEILEEISAKKREFSAKIRLDETFGKQSYYLIAKDKKRISTNDLTISLQNAQTQKMPALIVSPGDLDKKAQLYLSEWKNLIKFEKIKY